MTDQADFYALPQDEQIRRLCDLARTALRRWALDGAEVKPVAYRENMTFEVRAGDRGRFALRVHAAGYRTDAQIQSELDLMEYLDAEGIRTPRVVRAKDGASFVMAEHEGVKEARQIDLFEWIEGRPLRKSGEMPSGSVDEAAKTYTEVGRQAAAIYNATEMWERPVGYERLEWNADGIFGEGAHLGDFRLAESASDEQRKMLAEVADKLAGELEAFGKSSDRYGLSHGDYLAENIFVCDDGLRLIDFDDAGDTWHLFDAATAIFDLEGSEFYEPCKAGFVSGFREKRDLPEEHLAMLPAFTMARILSYLGHTVSRSHLAQSAPLQMYFLAVLDQKGPEFLKR